MQRIEFQGRTAQEAKRRALNYWYQHCQGAGVSLSQFFAQCRGSQGPGGVTIVYTPQSPDQRSAA